ncbi:hypothetical protein Tco_0193813 [Tanacetum coccineum]
MEITATIDGRVKTITEASIRRHLKLEDSDGISTLPNTKIFEQLALMGQETEVPQLSSPAHTNVVDEAASTSVDVRHGGVATTITSLDAGQGSECYKDDLMDLVTKYIQTYMVAALETDLRQTKKVYGDAFTRLIKKVTPTKVSAQGEAHTQQDQPEDHLRVLSAAKVLANVARKRREVVNVQSYTRRRRTVSTGSGEIRTAEEPVSIAGASMPVSTAGMVQEASTPSSVATKDKGKAIMQESEYLKKMKQRADSN